MKTFTLARLKGIAAFLGAVITFATTVLPLPGDNTWWTGVAAILTFVAVYSVPNVGYVRPAAGRFAHRRVLPGSAAGANDLDGNGRDDKTGRFLPRS